MSSGMKIKKKMITDRLQAVLGRTNRNQTILIVLHHDKSLLHARKPMSNKARLIFCIEYLKIAILQLILGIGK